MTASYDSDTADVTSESEKPARCMNRFGMVHPDIWSPACPLSTNAKAMYAAMSISAAGDQRTGCRRSIKTLAGMASMAKSTAEKALRELERAGAVEAVKRHTARGKGTGRAPTEWRLRDTDVDMAECFDEDGEWVGWGSPSAGSKPGGSPSAGLGGSPCPGSGASPRDGLGVARETGPSSTGKQDHEQQDQAPPLATLGSSPVAGGRECEPQPVGDQGPRPAPAPGPTASGLSLDLDEHDDTEHEPQRPVRTPDDVDALLDAATEVLDAKGHGPWTDRQRTELGPKIAKLLDQGVTPELIAAATTKLCVDPSCRKPGAPQVWSRRIDQKLKVLADEVEYRERARQSAAAEPTQGEPGASLASLASLAAFRHRARTAPVQTPCPVRTTRMSDQDDRAAQADAELAEYDRLRGEAQR